MVFRSPVGLDLIAFELAGKTRVTITYWESKIR